MNKLIWIIVPLLFCGCIKKNPMEIVGLDSETVTATGSDSVTHADTNGTDSISDATDLNGETESTANSSNPFYSNATDIITTDTDSSSDPSGSDSATSWDTTSENDENLETIWPTDGDTETSSSTDTATLTDTLFMTDTTTETSGSSVSGTDDTISDSAVDSNAIVDTTPPAVVSISPDNGAVGVHSDTTIVILFSEAMNEDSVESGVSVSSVLDGDLDFSWNDNRTQLTVTPGTELVYATGTDPDSATAREYSVTIGMEAMDVEGNGIEAPFTSSFATLRQITEELTQTNSAYYYTYNIATGKGVDICADDSAFHIGKMVNTGSSGTWHGLAAFETALANAIVQIDNVEMQLTQDAPDGDFYASGTVELEQLEYQTIDSSIRDAIPKMDLGTFCDSDVFAADFADGQTNFLFRFNGTGGTNNTFAMLRCQSFVLTVQYLLP